MAACLMKIMCCTVIICIFQLIRKPLSCILGQDIVTPIHAFHYVEISTVFFFSKYSLLIIQTYPSEITLIIMYKTTFYPQNMPQITFTLGSYNGMRQPNATLDFCVLNFSFSPKIPIYK